MGAQEQAFGRVVQAANERGLCRLLPIDEAMAIAARVGDGETDGLRAQLLEHCPSARGLAVAFAPDTDSGGDDYTMTAIPADAAEALGLIQDAGGLAFVRWVQDAPGRAPRAVLVLPILAIFVPPDALTDAAREADAFGAVVAREGR